MLTYGGLTSIDSMNFMKMSLNIIVKAMHFDDFIHTTKLFGDEGELFLKTCLCLSLFLKSKRLKKNHEQNSKIRISSQK